MAKKKGSKARKTVVVRVKGAQMRGRGDYSINGPKDALAAIHDVDKRLNKLEGKVSTDRSHLEDVLATAGGGLGSLFGAPAVGATLGKGAARLLSMLHGSGDYTVNSLVKPGSEAAVSKTLVSFGPNSLGAIRVQKREFVGYLTTSSTAGAFKSVNLRINPGSPALFPYQASTMALGFSRWRPLGLAFELKSIATEYSTTQPLGLMGVAVQYNSQTAAFPTVVAAQQAAGTVVAKVSDSILSGVECDVRDRGMDWLYIRNGPVPTTADVNTYDLGQVQFFTQGSAAVSSQIAEIWSVSDFEYCEPIQYGGPSGAQAISFTAVNATGVSGTTPFGNATWQCAGSFYIQPTVNTITFPPWVSGQFYVTFWWYQGTGGARQEPLTITATNCYVGQPSVGSSALSTGALATNAATLDTGGALTGGTGVALVFRLDIPLSADATKGSASLQLSADGNLGTGTTFVMTMAQIDSPEGVLSAPTALTSTSPW